MNTTPPLNTDLELDTMRNTGQKPGATAPRGTDAELESQRNTGQKPGATAPRNSGMDLDALRQRLASARGPTYWRSLEELAAAPEFQEYVAQEFPADAEVWKDGVSRRRFLQLMAASLALAGLQGCARGPDDVIVPYVQPPDGVVPGKPLFFATGDSLGGVARGLLATSHDGRPTHVDGNAQHPASPGPYRAPAAPFEAGAVDVFAQASLLDLYDPDRSQTVQNLGVDAEWGAFVAMANANQARLARGDGVGVRLLTRTVNSPSLAGVIRAFLNRFPQARWHQYEPINRDNARAGAVLAFGRDVYARYAFDRANVVLTLDADFLGVDPLAMRHAHDFMARRTFEAEPDKMNRLYAVETSFTSTGAVADHRLALRPSEVEALARALAARLGVPPGAGGATQPSGTKVGRWLDAVANDLHANQGAALVVAGREQPPAVHALVHLMNHALGGVGQTVVYSDPVEEQSVDQLQDLRTLAGDMDAGLVDTLVVLEANPVYEAPADLRFAQRLAKVPLRIHLGLYADETAVMCHWHVNQAHALETWNDARTFDGTVSVFQPLIAPLYDGKTPQEVLSVLLGHPDRTAHQVVKEHWRTVVGTGWEQRHEHGDFEGFWRKTLHDGLMGDTQMPVVNIEPQESVVLPPPGGATDGGTSGGGAGTLEVSFRPDPTVWDGRFANNGWLQELPKPMTKLTWDNALMLSPATAAGLGVGTQDVVKVTYRGRSMEVVVFVLPGHAEGAATLSLGYGRWQSGRAGTRAGFNANLLRTSDAPWGSTGLAATPTGRTYALADVQGHQVMEGRDIIHHETLAEHIQELRTDTPTNDPEDRNIRPLALYSPYKYDTGDQWGMSINLSTCIGCNACVVACQQENNIAVVGKEQVINDRHMHWVRVDRYFQGGPDQPDAHFQPVPCMHCENAPCEVVCPVGATQHSQDGLNEMVYNRCIGTRYCSNNCPYKVRRFNFLAWVDKSIETYKLMRNPEVTVRGRGVMEKCTYCIQRIAAVKITTQIADRSIIDGEIATACQTACPTEAIVFGNINDPESKVTARKKLPNNYGLLTELNTRPRTTYLARVRNPNPLLAGEAGA